MKTVSALEGWLLAVRGAQMVEMWPQMIQETVGWSSPFLLKTFVLNKIKRNELSRFFLYLIKLV